MDFNLIDTFGGAAAVNILFNLFRCRSAFFEFIKAIFCRFVVVNSWCGLCVMTPTARAVFGDFSLAKKQHHYFSIGNSFFFPYFASTS